MNEDEQIEQAKKRVGDFIGDAKRFMFDRMERSLLKIAKMNWWQRLWKAGDLADRTLGVGKYWNADMKDDGL